MKIQISFTQTIIKSQISYSQAIELKAIQDLKAKLEKAKETSRYLYGKRKGAWGRMTAADEKRSLQITKLQSELNYKLKKYTQNYEN